MCLVFLPTNSTATTLPPITVTGSCADLGLIKIDGKCEYPSSVYENDQLREDPLGSGGGSSIGTGARIGSIFVSLDTWIDIINGLAPLTVDWAKKDIKLFRDFHLHVTNPQGSLIPWQDAQVNWNLYGADNSSLSVDQVWENFATAITRGITGI